MNIAPISGGVAANVLAANATAFVSFRVTTTSQELLDMVTKIVDGRADIAVRHQNEPLLHSSESSSYKCLGLKAVLLHARTSRIQV